MNNDRGCKVAPRTIFKVNPLEIRKFFVVIKSCRRHLEYENLELDETLYSETNLLPEVSYNGISEISKTKLLIENAYWKTAVIDHFLSIPASSYCPFPSIITLNC